MKVLVTGSKGQLGSEIHEMTGLYPQLEFIFTDVDELNIADGAAVNRFLNLHHPGAVINCAAYTAVDKAESDPETAFLINATAVANLSKSCKETNAFLVHISTDYVFDGKTWSPLKETDETRPVSAYARSKWQGEQEVMKHAEKALILRTSWLYSFYGANFVKTILRYGKERGKLNVVYDQTGTPTYAKDLARAILDILVSPTLPEGVEVCHYSNEGVCSWYDFAKAILEMSNTPCLLNPIETKDYPLPAARPFYSVLSKEKIRNDYRLEIPYWRDSLRDCLTRLGY